jgi:hypothetical protein
LTSASRPLLLPYQVNAELIKATGNPEMRVVVAVGGSALLERGEAPLADSGL